MNEHAPAVHMTAEMAEQPAILARFAARFDAVVEDVRDVAGSGVAGVAFLARGSSDNAALLGRYAVELGSGLPTCLVAPSVATAYERHPTGFAGWLVVALSQSGSTPEIVNLAEQFEAAGAVVIGVTNDTASRLASVSRLTIGLDAGPETAVPATKTVTSQMLAVLAVAAAVGFPGSPCVLTAEQAGLAPEAVATVLDDFDPMRRVAADLAGVYRLAVVGRGFSFPAALETALKLQETAGLMAHGFSTADFRHGPIAACGPDAPAVLLAGSGPADADTRDIRQPLAARRARTFLFGTGTDGVDAAWPVSGTATECLLATVRGQQLALALCLQRGIDPDQPAGLNKVTLTH
jgi:glucosamine--fructose-6-phosphate aminotransferase (isomerizing)